MIRLETKIKNIWEVKFTLLMENTPFSFWALLLGVITTIIQNTSCIHFFLRLLISGSSNIGRIVGSRVINYDSHNKMQINQCKIDNWKNWQIQKLSKTFWLIPKDGKMTFWLTSAQAGEVIGLPIDRLRWWWWTEWFFKFGSCRFISLLLWSSIACCSSACSSNFLLNINSCVNIFDPARKASEIQYRFLY